MTRCESPLHKSASIFTANQISASVVAVDFDIVVSEVATPRLALRVSVLENHFDFHGFGGKNFRGLFFVERKSNAVVNHFDSFRFVFRTDLKIILRIEESERALLA